LKSVTLTIVQMAIMHSNMFILPGQQLMVKLNRNDLRNYFSDWKCLMSQMMPLELLTITKMASGNGSLELTQHVSWAGFPQ
jgi:hypothetical protein